MPWLVRCLRERGVRFVHREVGSFEEPLAAARMVVNCCGLGARELCDDDELQAVRGGHSSEGGANVGGVD